jgi:hypothetical protein
MGWNDRRYERVERHPLGRAPRWSFDDEEELSHVRQTPAPVYRGAFDRELTDDFDVPAGVPRRRFRRAAWRLMGAIAIGGAFYGIAQIALHPDARREIAQWVTLGHADQVDGAEHTVHKWIDWIRTW